MFSWQIRQLIAVVHAAVDRIGSIWTLPIRKWAGGPVQKFVSLPDLNDQQGLLYGLPRLYVNAEIDQIIGFGF